MVGEKYNIQQIQEEDAQAFLKLQVELDQETKYMLLLPHERDLDIEHMQMKIKKFNANHDLFIVAKSAEGEIFGYLSAEKGEYTKTKHSAYIIIGILKKASNQGLGTAFFEELEKWRFQQNLKRLELTVISENAVAVHLYQKMGFEIEGIAKCSTFQDGKYIDDYHMAKIYNNQ